MWRDAVQAFHQSFDRGQGLLCGSWNTWQVRRAVSRLRHADEQTAQLRFFFVDQSLQGLGMGNRLMELALGFCREKGYTAMCFC